MASISYLNTDHSTIRNRIAMSRKKIEEAMRNFDYAASGYSIDTTQGRVFYFYHDPERFWKYVRPVKKL